MIDKTTLEIVYRSVEYISEKMGVVLKRCAVSPNIRDRMDMSCLITDNEGRIIAQAEHIPVHLGSMYVGMRHFLEYLKSTGEDIRPGDIFITNDPYIIGTHLNDVALLMPVFYNDKLVLWLVNKAHHVDVGGKYPGGLSLRARSIYDEGLVIEPEKIVDGRHICKEFLRHILSRVRMSRTMYSDIMAQISSLKSGEIEILQILDKYGVSKFKSSIEYMLNYSEDLCKKRIEMFSIDSTGQDYVEVDGFNAKISTSVRICKSRVYISFEDSSKQLEYPFNSALGVTIASILFVFRSLFFNDVPINDGVYRMFTIGAEPGLIVNPIKPAPVGLGNVETSQRIVDSLLNALSKELPDIPAQSGGTMTNVILHGLDTGWVFYETIGCGAGASYEYDGESGVHVYMTNTLNTPIEVIERTYPLRVVKYGIRRDSGGLGRWKGGDGIIRALQVLERTLAIVVMDRVRINPKGRRGGRNAQCGKISVVRGDGRIEEFSSGKVEIILEPGDILIVETPGGAGYGE